MDLVPVCVLRPSGSKGNFPDTKLKSFGNLSCRLWRIRYWRGQTWTVFFMKQTGIQLGLPSVFRVLSSLFMLPPFHLTLQRVFFGNVSSTSCNVFSTPGSVLCFCISSVHCFWISSVLCFCISSVLCFCITSSFSAMFPLLLVCVPYMVLSSASALRPLFI